MAKILLSMQDLRRRALAEIRQQPGCHNVQDIAINRVMDQSAKIIGRYVCCQRALENNGSAPLKKARFKAGGLLFYIATP
jgi:hypothetical protein